MHFNWKKQIAAVALTSAVFMIGSLSGPRQLLAQVRAALVQDVDSPGRQPFQATVQFSGTNLASIPVSIPSGKRLVIDFVAINGTTASAGGQIQPVFLIQSSVAGSPTTSFYLEPPLNSTQGQQFYTAQPLTIYADSLSVSDAYSGFAPSFMAFNVNISGHLISMQ